MCTFFLLGSGRVTKLSLPLYLGEEGGEGLGGEEVHQPYRELSITVILQLPCITIHPPQILLTPVPLGSNASATFTLLALGYPRLVYIHPRPKTDPVTVTFYDCLTFDYLNHDTRTAAL